MKPTAIGRLCRLIHETNRILLDGSCLLLLILIFLSSHSPVTAQPSLTATSDRQEAVLGETVSVRFVLRGSNEVGGFVPPPFNGFTVVHGPDTRLEFSNERGLKVPMATFAYLLRADRTGVLEIGSASAGSTGWRVYSPALQVRVTQTPRQKAGSGALYSSDREVEAMVRSGLFIRLETDRTDVFVGEPILVTYKLYTRLNSESQVVRRPTFAGFSVLEVERSDSSAPVDEIIDGETYQSYVLRKAHLIPLREGSYELEPVVVHNKVDLKGSSLTYGNSSLSRLLSKLYPDGGYEDGGIKKEVTLKSPTRSIRVRPLPSGAPPDFTGAVGRFRLSLKPERDTLGAGEVGSLKVVLEGSGNLPLAGLPNVQWPEDVEVFDSEMMEEVDPSRAPLSGSRTSVVPFSSKRHGLLTLKTVSMSAFDPTAGRYYSLNAEPVSVFVTAPAQTISEQTGTSSDTQADGILLYLAFALVAGLAVAISYYAIWGRVNVKPRRRPHRAAEGTATVQRKVKSESFDAAPPMQTASSLLSEGRPAESCRELQRVLSRTAFFLFGVSASSGLEGFAERLAANGVVGNDAEEWADLLRACEIEAFSPVADSETAGRLLERVKRLLGAYRSCGDLNR